MRYASAEVRAGDDIRTLAQRLLGDQHQWRDLVTINRLEPPYVVGDASGYEGRVLGPGDSLLYPGDASGVPQAADLSHNVEADTYGRDLALTDDGRLILSGTSLAIATGVENLRDATHRRTNTALGGHPAHPRTYGHAAKQYVGGVGDAINLRLIEQEFERCIRRDSRVATVTTRGTYDGVKVVGVQSLVTPIPPGRDFVIEQELA